jgi:hypothetical protein
MDRDPLERQRLLIDACLSHRVPFWWQGTGTLLISSAGARSVIEELESLGEKVIGVEAFELESTVIHPRLDLIYDASVAPRGGPAALVTEWGDDLWLDVTLVDKPRPSG